MPHSSFIRLLLSAATLALTIACSSPSGPTPPPGGGAPTVQCPADVQAQLIEGTEVPVNYPLAQAVGGAAPVAVACVAPSGSPFVLGDTTVTCTATDSASRTASCTFRVSVTRVPRLRGTRVLAFGDSITWGVVSQPAPNRVRSAGPAGSYPALLQDKLRARYAAQTVEVINEGQPGELLTGEGEDRLERLVERHRPDMLIVLEGVNDIGTKDPELVGDVLRSAVRRAVRANVPLVMVSTLLPGVQGRIKPPDPDRVDALNDEIRSWASAEGAVLVDTFHAVDPMKELFIGQDGLHPTPAGYEFLADVFLDVIKNHFEAAAPADPARLASPTWPFSRRP